MNKKKVQYAASSKFHKADNYHKYPREKAKLEKLVTCQEKPDKDGKVKDKDLCNPAKDHTKNVMDPEIYKKLDPNY